LKSGFAPVIFPKLEVFSPYSFSKQPLFSWLYSYNLSLSIWFVELVICHFHSHKSFTPILALGPL
jgi:hypothetical protein